MQAYPVSHWKLFPNQTAHRFIFCLLEMFIFFYLKGIVTQKGGSKQGERRLERNCSRERMQSSISYSRCPPKWIELVQVEARSQEPHLGFPYGEQVPKPLSHHLLPPRYVNKELSGKQNSWHLNLHSDVGCKCPKPKLNPLCYNIHAGLFLGLWCSCPWRKAAWSTIT